MQDTRRTMKSMDTDAINMFHLIEDNFAIVYGFEPSWIFIGHFLLKEHETWTSGGIPKISVNKCWILFMSILFWIAASTHECASLITSHQLCCLIYTWQYWKWFCIVFSENIFRLCGRCTVATPRACCFRGDDSSRRQDCLFAIQILPTNTCLNIAVCWIASMDSLWSEYEVISPFQIAYLRMSLDSSVVLWCVVMVHVCACAQGHLHHALAHLLHQLHGFLDWSWCMVQPVGLIGLWIVAGLIEVLVSRSFTMFWKKNFKTSPKLGTLQWQRHTPRTKLRRFGSSAPTFSYQNLYRPSRLDART